MSIAYNFTPLKQVNAATPTGTSQVEVVQPDLFGLSRFREQSKTELRKGDGTASSDIERNTAACIVTCISTM